MSMHDYVTLASPGKNFRYNGDHCVVWNYTVHSPTANITLHHTSYRRTMVTKLHLSKTDGMAQRKHSVGFTTQHRNNIEFTISFEHQQFVDIHMIIHDIQLLSKSCEASSTYIEFLNTHIIYVLIFHFQPLISYIKTALSILCH